MAATPSAPAADTPEDELKKKQGQLKEIQNGMIGLQADIKVLQAKIAELHQCLAGYDKASEAMQQRLAAAERLIGEKSSIAEAVIRDMKPQIDQTIVDFDKTLADQAGAVYKASEDAQLAGSEAGDADRDSQRKQAAYDAVKRVTKDTEAALTELGSLLEQTAKAESQGDFVAMYFLVGEARTLTSSIKVPSADDYSKSLRTAQDDAERAKEAAAAKKAKTDQLWAAYNSAKQQLDTIQKSRRSDVLNRLKTIRPKVA